MNGAADWLIGYLIHSSWQIPVLAVGTAGLVRFAGRGDAKLQYRLWLGCLLLGILLPALPDAPAMIRTRKVSPDRGESRPTARVGSLDQTGTGDLVTVYLERMAEPARSGWARGFLVCVYGLSLVAGSARLLRRLRTTEAIVREATRITFPPDISSALARSAKALGVRQFAVRSSAQVRNPATVNWPEAILLVPEDFSLVGAQDAVAALSHELAHVRRRDFLVNLAVEAASIVAFYHPITHWTKANVADSREAVCDEMAAEATSGRTPYARSLLALAEAGSLKPVVMNLSLGLLEASALERRIMRLVEQRIPLSRGRRAFAAACCWTVVAALSVGLMTVSSRASRAQTFGAALQETSPAAFEVVSVRPNRSVGGHMGITGSGNGIWMANISLRRIVNAAFNVRLNSLIAGLPDWANTERFDITAKVGESDRAAYQALGPTEKGLMLQAVLQDRFKMKFHYETKELPVYELAIGKDGPKFKEGEFAIVEGGAHEVGMSSGRGELRASGVSMADVVRVLSAQLERPVVDKTGLAGKYVFTVKWTTDSEAGSGADGGAAQDAIGPSAFTAVQEQLGLKLVSAKDPVKTLVIDHIERPSEN